MRVLVVEDEAMILTLTASWLEDLGCVTRSARPPAWLTPV